MFHIAVPLNKWVYGHRFFEVIPCSTNLGQPPGRPSNKNGGWFSIYLYIMSQFSPCGLGWEHALPHICAKKRGFKKCFSWVKFPLTPQTDELNPQFHPYFTHFSRFFGATFFGRAPQPGDPRCHCHFLHRRWTGGSGGPQCHRGGAQRSASRQGVTIFLGKRPNN